MGKLTVVINDQFETGSRNMTSSEYDVTDDVIFLLPLQNRSFIATINTCREIRAAMYLRIRRYFWRPEFRRRRVYVDTAYRTARPRRPDMFQQDRTHMFQIPCYTTSPSCKPLQTPTTNKTTGVITIILLNALSHV